MESKVFDRDDDVAAWETSRDPDTPDRKRKASDDRQPESPPDMERKRSPENWHREKTFRSTTDPMDTDSPASYPKHLVHSEQADINMGANGSRYLRDASDASAKLATPILGADEASSTTIHGDPYETPSYRSTTSANHHYMHGRYHHEGGFQGHTPPSNTGGHYLPDMDASPAHYVTPQQPDVPMRPRRWACDYCNVATFVSYEEACAHEEACAQKYYERYGTVHPSRGPVPQYDHQAQTGHQQLGSPDPAAASQGYGAANTAHQYGMFDGHYNPYQYGYHGHHHGYHHGYHYPHHAAPHQQQPLHHHHPSYHQPQNQRYGGYNHANVAYNKPTQAPRREAYPTAVIQTNSDGEPQRCMSLALPTDSESLSDRQLFVRAEMIELFAATDKDVSARHSKGAQKLVEGQVGIRCRYCKHLRPRDRSERAVCYPSSISRIYQTVADMQRFHFEQCKQIPSGVARHYKSLKTTRPRGTGSPQTYWIQSAKLLDLVDTPCGIRLGSDLDAEEEAKQAAAADEEQQDQEEIRANESAPAS